MQTASVGKTFLRYTFFSVLGMVGIFVVMGLIMGAVFLLNRFAGDKPKDPEQKDKK